MSKPANPYTIGAFLVGALTLLVVAVLLFGGGQLLKKKSEFVIYFDGALNGLNVGAPVKLQGVQIGTVKEISLELDPQASRISKPVVIEIDPAVLLHSSGKTLNSNTPEQGLQSAKPLIEAGLKAQLQTQSLLTGLLYVEFNFFRDEPIILTGLNYKGLAELPSVPTTVDQIKNTADEILTRLRQLPLEEIIKDLAVTMKEVRDLMTSEDIKKSRTALAQSLGETEKLIANLNRDLVPLLANMNDTTIETKGLIKDFGHDIRPVLASTEKALTQATTALESATGVLQESKHTLGSVETLTAPDAPLWQSLEALRDAAQSTKTLTDYLERHPDSLIYGKD